MVDEALATFHDVTWIDELCLGDQFLDAIFDRQRFLKFPHRENPSSEKYPREYFEGDSFVLALLDPINDAAVCVGDIPRE
jgi:hypothetical protein